jgi:2-methylisocitrate lyase-like PEP mutase family enzyme
MSHLLRWKVSINWAASLKAIQRRNPAAYYSKMAVHQNETAKALKALHSPGSPLILTNVWDALSATAIASLPSTKALATASAAVAAAAALDDDDLTLPINLSAARAVATVAKRFNKPLTVDFQDGYGNQLESGVRALIKAGVVGINLEDFGREIGTGGGLYPIDVAVSRIKTVLDVARSEGVPDFVINARSDALLAGKDLSEAIERGQKYLDAGASNVFVWGGKARGGITRQEVVDLTKAFGGRLNVSLRLAPGGLSIQELKDIGVARISIGPQLTGKVGDFLQREVENLLRE